MSISKNDPLRDSILEALESFIERRPGTEPLIEGIRNSPLEVRNFFPTDARRWYNREMRRGLNDARAMLRYVESRPSITGDDLQNALSQNRLNYTPERGVEATKRYYWPTEYRNSVCRSLSTVICQDLHDDGCDDDSIVIGSICPVHGPRPGRPPCVDFLREAVNDALGSSITGRWFHFLRI